MWMRDTPDRKSRVDRNWKPYNGEWCLESLPWDGVSRRVVSVGSRLPYAINAAENEGLRRMWVRRPESETWASCWTAGEPAIRGPPRRSAQSR